MMHFIDLLDFSVKKIRDLLKLGLLLKQDKIVDQSCLLAPFTLAMVFEKPSLRTRVSFEMAMHQSGGKAIQLLPQEVGLGVREPVEDVARVLSRYVDCVMLRTFSHQQLLKFSAASGVPVINGLTDFSHPCQALADLLTIQETFGDSFDLLKVVFLGDYNNVSRSLAYMASLLGFELVICCPKSFIPDEPLTGVSFSHDPAEAIRGAQVVYTDVWVSMGQEAESTARRTVFLPFQVTVDLMKLADPQAIFLHCLPVIRGEEVVASVIDGDQSRVFDQAENRLHAQKAVLFDLLLDSEQIKDV